VENDVLVKNIHPNQQTISK